MFRGFLAVVFAVVSTSVGFADGEDNEREGGILGTGILGTITALGSIYVNGQHILFDPNLSVTEGVSVDAASELRPGHTVAVVANREDDHWRASDIRQVVPLVGPAQKVSDGRLEVIGTTVITDARIAHGIRTGDWIAVSGLWQSGRVIATRIDRVKSNRQARIEGTAIGFEPDQPLRIGGTDVTGVLPRHIQEGDVVRAYGIASISSLLFDRLETGVFGGTPQVIFSEGYFSVPTPSGLYTLLGSDIVSYTDNPAMIDPSARQFVCRNNGQLYQSLADQVDVESIAPILTDCLSIVVE